MIIDQNEKAVNSRDTTTCNNRGNPKLTMKLSQEQLILCGSSLVLMVLLIHQLLSRTVKTVSKISEAFTSIHHRLY